MHLNRVQTQILLESNSGGDTILAYKTENNFPKFIRKPNKRIECSFFPKTRLRVAVSTKKTCFLCVYTNDDEQNIISKNMCYCFFFILDDFRERLTKCCFDCNFINCFL
jgi:hypothetical protein